MHNSAVMCVLSSVQHAMHVPQSCVLHPVRGLACMHSSHPYVLHPVRSMTCVQGRSVPSNVWHAPGISLPGAEDPSASPPISHQAPCSSHCLLHAKAGLPNLLLLLLRWLPQVSDLDAIVVPVSGGGMISGISIAAHHLAQCGRCKPGLRVVAAEPMGRQVRFAAGWRAWRVQGTSRAESSHCKACGVQCLRLDVVC